MIRLGSKKGQIEKDIWVADTGATRYKMKSNVSIYEMEEVKQQVMIGDGTLINLMKSGKSKVLTMQKMVMQYGLFKKTSYMCQN
jgi:S-adenosylhomocysteine hydrolase